MRPRPTPTLMLALTAAVVAGIQRVSPVQRRVSRDRTLILAALTSPIWPTATVDEAPAAAALGTFSREFLVDSAVASRKKARSPDTILNIKSMCLSGQPFAAA